MEPIFNVRRQFSACFNIAIIALLAFTITGCAALERTRSLSDRAAAHYESFTLKTLVEAETERRRLRKARCYNPMLSPGSISAAAADPRLGSVWVEELLADCPPFSAFISDLILRRAHEAGLFSRPEASQ